MADIPAAPTETGPNEREMLFMTESDGAGGLQSVLFTPAANDGVTTEGQRLQALAVGGRKASGDPATDGPVVTGLEYHASPTAVDDGDVVSALGDEKGRARVVGAVADGDSATDVDPVLAGGVYNDTSQYHNDGDAVVFQTDELGSQYVMSPVATSVSIYSVTVSSSSTQALSSSSNRVSAVFTNDSNQVIYLSLDGTAAMNAGIRLNPNGGSYEINATNMFRGYVYAICASGGANLCVIETRY